MRAEGGGAGRTGRGGEWAGPTRSAGAGWPESRGSPQVGRPSSTRELAEDTPGPQLLWPKRAVWVADAGPGLPGRTSPRPGPQSTGLSAPAVPTTLTLQSALPGNPGSAPKPPNRTRQEAPSSGRAPGPQAARPSLRPHLALNTSHVVLLATQPFFVDFLITQFFKAHCTFLCPLASSTFAPRNACIRGELCVSVGVPRSVRTRSSC